MVTTTCPARRVEACLHGRGLAEVAPESHEVQGLVRLRELFGMSAQLPSLEPSSTSTSS